MEKGMICGCVVDGDNIPCVFDDSDYTVADCDHATRLHAEGKGRDDCERWEPLADEEHASRHTTTELERMYDAIGLQGSDRCIDGVIGAHILNTNAIKLLTEAQ